MKPLVRSKSKKIIIGIIFTALVGFGLFSLYNYYYTAKVPYTVYAPTEVKGERVTLRTLKEENFLDYHNMFSDTVRKNLEFPKNITFGYTAYYLRLELEQSAQGNQLHYLIFDKPTNKLIGSIEVRELDDINPGQLGCWVNENYWGGGRFQEALHLINKTYFKLKPKADSYIAHVRLWNKRSYHALKKYGFVEEGYFNENGKPARHLLRMYRKNIPTDATFYKK